MQKEETDPSTKQTSRAKNCCLMAMAAALACPLLVITGIACIIVVDTINLRGEEHTLSWRVERYKVACQFLWFDFKDWISKKCFGTVYADDFRAGESSPDEPEIVQFPADPPESEPEPEQ